MTIWMVVIFARNRERTFQSSRVVAEIWSRLKAGRQTENCQDPEDQTSPRSRRKTGSSLSRIHQQVKTYPRPEIGLELLLREERLDRLAPGSGFGV